MPRTRKPETPLSPSVLETDDAGLNLRQKRFIEYYLQTGNASEAARMAGYSHTNVSARAYELLRHPRVSAEIQRREAESLGKLSTKAGRFQELSGIALDESNSAKNRLDAIRLISQLLGDFTAKSLSLSLTGTLDGQSGDKNGFQVDPRPTESDIKKTVRVLREIKIDDQAVGDE